MIPPLLCTATVFVLSELIAKSRDPGSPAAAAAGVTFKLWSTAVNVPARSAVAITVCKILRRSLR